MIVQVCTDTFYTEISAPPALPTDELIAAKDIVFGALGEIERMRHGHDADKTKIASLVSLLETAVQKDANALFFAGLMEKAQIDGATLTEQTRTIVPTLRALDPGHQDCEAMSIFCDIFHTWLIASGWLRYKPQFCTKRRFAMLQPYNGL